MQELKTVEIQLDEGGEKTTEAVGLAESTLMAEGKGEWWVTYKPGTLPCPVPCPVAWMACGLPLFPAPLLPCPIAL